MRTIDTRGSLQKQYADTLTVLNVCGSMKIQSPLGVNDPAFLWGTYILGENSNV